jgi:hypothetical protein
VVRRWARPLTNLAKKKLLYCQCQGNFLGYSADPLNLHLAAHSLLLSRAGAYVGPYGARHHSAKNVEAPTGLQSRQAVNLNIKISNTLQDAISVTRFLTFLSCHALRIRIYTNDLPLCLAPLLRSTLSIELAHMPSVNAFPKSSTVTTGP